MSAICNVLKYEVKDTVHKGTWKVGTGLDLNTLL
jgi:hypothetical protein